MTHFPNSLHTRLMAYFAANPDEELSRADIAVKFSMSIKTVDIVLANARKAGELESVHAWRLSASMKGRA